MNNKLTAKQEKFVNNVIKGMSQREAYRDAYAKSKNWEDSSVDCEASKLFNSTKILQRYNELLDKARDEAIMSAKERQVWLSDVIKGNIKEEVMVRKIDSEGNETVSIKEFPTEVKNKIKAVDTLNKMTGEYTVKLKGDISIEKLEDLL